MVGFAKFDIIQDFIKLILLLLCELGFAQAELRSEGAKARLGYA